MSAMPKLLPEEAAATSDVKAKPENAKSL